MDTKWHLGFMGICRDRVCWTLLDHWTMVSVRFHGLVCFAGVFVVESNTG